jgi:nondiscriminating glutamyl-tRNA synthetase
MSDDKYLQWVQPFIKFDKSNFKNDKILDIVLLIFKPQISYATQINQLVTNTFLNVDLKNLSAEMRTIVETDSFQKCIRSLEHVLSTCDDITLLNGNDIVNKVKESTGLKGKELYFPIRFVSIAKEHGPEMNKILTVVGKEQILKNIKLLEK